MNPFDNATSEKIILIQYGSFFILNGLLAVASVLENHKINTKKLK